MSVKEKSEVERDRRWIFARRRRGRHSGVAKLCGNLLINGLEVASGGVGVRERERERGSKDALVNLRCNLALRRSSNSNCQQQLSRLNTLGSRSCNLHARVIAGCAVAALACIIRTYVFVYSPSMLGERRRELGSEDTGARDAAP